MLEQGDHPKIVQEKLGNENIETTLNTYSHVSYTIMLECHVRIARPLATPSFCAKAILRPQEPCYVPRS